MCKAVKRGSNEELLSVAQEIAFAKALAANDKSLRDRALKKLRKWFCMKSRQDSPGLRFTEEGFMRLWKGLFYCVWMSDKPLVQEEVVESVSNLIHCFSHLEDVRGFVRCFFQSVSQCWLGLDGHRMDKYLMLIRRFLRQTFEYLYNQDWNEESVDALCEDLFKSFQIAPIGLNLHLAEIYLEELAKIGRGELKPETVLKIIKPFADFMALSSDTRLLRYGTNFIFFHLIRQSDEGIKYGAKFEIWKEMGFPGGDIDVIREASDDEIDPDDEELDDEGTEDASSSAMDPRAGNVDTILPPIDFDAVSIRDYLIKLSKQKDTTTKGRKTFGLITKKLNHYIGGKYPLGIHKCEVPEIEDQEEIIEKTAEELLKEDKAFAMERKQYKGLKNTEPSNAWEVTPLRETDLGEASGSVPNSGKWEVQNFPQKRKNKNEIKACGTLKKVKVILDDSLLSCPDENAGSETTKPPLEPDTKESLVSTLNTLKIQDKKRRKKRKNKKAANSKKQKTDENEKPMSEIDETTSKLEKVCKIIISDDPTNEEQNNNNGVPPNDWDITVKWDTPNKEKEIVIPFSPVKLNKSMSKSETPLQSKIPNFTSKKKTSSAKKVEFVLNRNTAQGEQEYKISLQNSPSIPFDADKKPTQGVLKIPTLGSPINPFYMETN